jgi:hypothetical protein
MSAGKATSTKSITIARLLTAALCDATQGNLESVRRYFTDPAFDPHTGKLYLKTIRKTQGAVLTSKPTLYEEVSWEFTMVAKQTGTRRLKPGDPALPQEAPTDG